jgi:hypothetical protein
VEATPRSSARLIVDSLSVPAIVSVSWAGSRWRNRSVALDLLGVVADNERLVVADLDFLDA